jgi:hypothetical protein
MAKTELEILNDIRVLVDDLEEQYGDLEGFEILLTKKKNDDGAIDYSELKEVNLYYLKKANILKDKV